MATERQIIELSHALIKAREKASRYENLLDEGTCNFDAPQIFLQNWTSEDIDRAFDKACLRYDIQQRGKNTVVEIYGCLSGQASRRTQMAEAVRDSLKADGYEAYVYYQID